MDAYHIHITGRVQGVGFRPFVYQLATSWSLKGWVHNASDGVHIQIEVSEQTAERFYRHCLEHAPRLSLISNSTLEKVPSTNCTDFQIVESQNSPLELNLSPDFAMCADCREELHTATDRRYRYPFLTCTNCGPRYSILTGLPYDRQFTTMDLFHMCESCDSEYHDPNDRRYYAQTNSCEDCGVRMQGKDRRGNFAWANTEELLTLVVERLRQGQIVAVKGIGGYLLLCDAHSDDSIETLRSRKQRPTKPFAVLFENFQSLSEHCEFNDAEQALLDGPIAPIVLLPAKRSSDLPLGKIAPGLDRIGVMIPYAPLLELIATDFGGPLIATSANESGAPIVFDDDDRPLLQLADFMLSNNRPITFPQDDSVMQLSPLTRQPIVLRRSRGMAPGVMVNLQNEDHADTLALGAEMKGTFALSTGPNLYLSQYLGSLGHFDNQLQYEQVLGRFLDLVKPTLRKVVIDAHPGYFVRELGQTMARTQQLELIKVQHHEAHFASILGERELLDEERVLGVIWDGTGYGSDGQTWGGEFFDYSESRISRRAHLAYFTHLANDRMARDNRLCALSLAGESHREELRPYFTGQEWGYYTRSLDRSEHQTSSMGRVFDAVAFLAGASEENSFEGRSAMLLERQARNQLKKGGEVSAYPFEWIDDQLSLKPMFSEIFEDRKSRSSMVALRFHLTLVAMVRSMAEKEGFSKIAFSGGVFQNSMLIDLLSQKLGSDFELYFHETISSNDENIAFGQLVYANHIDKIQHSQSKEQVACV